MLDRGICVANPLPVGRCRARYVAEAADDLPWEWLPQPRYVADVRRSCGPWSDDTISLLRHQTRTVFPVQLSEAGGAPPPW